MRKNASLENNDLKNTSIKYLRWIANETISKMRKISRFSAFAMLCVIDTQTSFHLNVEYTATFEQINENDLVVELSYTP